MIENHDLIADIEQDRYITNTLDQSRFIFGKFPLSLEQAYQSQGQKMHLNRCAQGLMVSAGMIVTTALFELLSGGSLSTLLGILPAIAMLVIGVLLQKSPVFSLFQQVFFVMFAAVLGYGVQGFMIQEASGQHWMMMYALAMLAIVARAPVQLPALGCMAIAAGIVAVQPGNVVATGFYFALCLGAGLAFWMWREDTDRRQFLQFCMPPAAAPVRNTGGVKETERARQLVVLDKQTGLANNTSFMRFFTNEWRRAFRARQSLSLILIRLDVTIEKLTEHGHLDRVLTELQRYSRRPGDMVGKMDDRSFAVLLSNTDISNSRRLAESLLEHLHGLDLAQDGSLKVFMGVASTLPMPSMSHEDLYAKASEALNSAEDKPR